MRRIACLIVCLILFISLASTYAYARDELIYSPDFYTLAQYESYLANSKLPRDFVHVSRLSLFGDFNRCLFNYQRTAYTYSLSTGLSITIDHNTMSVAHGMIHQDHLPDGVTTILRVINPERSTFCYFRNGLYYVYNSGRLNTVAWFASGILFQIKISASDWDSYASIPVLLGLLSLSEEESDAAIAEICQSIGVRLQKTHFQIRHNRNQWIVQALFIIPLSVFLIIRWIIAKRRRARGIVTRRQQCATRDAIGELPLSAFTNHETPFDTPNSH